MHSRIRLRDEYREKYEELFKLASNWRIQRLTQYVAANLTVGLSLREAAEICALERTYFCRFFQAQTGIRFSLWNRDIRIKRAKRLLLDGCSSLAEVAAAVGYNDVTTFRRHFLKSEKMSPTQYRRQATNTTRFSNHNTCSQIDNT